jgi:hypothetical protein
MRKDARRVIIYLNSKGAKLDKLKHQLSRYGTVTTFNADTAKDDPTRVEIQDNQALPGHDFLIVTSAIKTGVTIHNTTRVGYIVCNHAHSSDVEQLANRTRDTDIKVVHLGAITQGTADKYKWFNYNTWHAHNAARAAGLADARNNDPDPFTLEAHRKTARRIVDTDLTAFNPETNKVEADPLLIDNHTATAETYAQYSDPARMATALNGYGWQCDLQAGTIEGENDHTTAPTEEHPDAAAARKEREFIATLTRLKDPHTRETEARKSSPNGGRHARKMFNDIRARYPEATALIGLDMLDNPGEAAARNITARVDATADLITIIKVYKAKGKGKLTPEQIFAYTAARVELNDATPSDLQTIGRQLVKLGLFAKQPTNKEVLNRLRLYRPIEARKTNGTLLYTAGEIYNFGLNTTGVPPQPEQPAQVEPQPERTRDAEPEPAQAATAHTARARRPQPDTIPSKPPPG